MRICPTAQYHSAYEARRIEGRLMAAKKVKRKLKAVAVAVEYHVVPNGQRWDVERDNAFTGQFAYEVNTAIGLSIAAAMRDQHNGAEASVCVQEPNGHCRHVWP